MPLKHGLGAFFLNVKQPEGFSDCSIEGFYLNISEINNLLRTADEIFYCQSAETFCSARFSGGGDFFIKFLYLVDENFL